MTQTNTEGGSKIRGHVIDALTFWGAGFRHVTTGYSAKALPDELLDALLAAGKSHQILGLSGVTHMPTDPVIATNMVQLELDFFAEALRR